MKKTEKTIATRSNEGLKHLVPGALVWFLTVLPVLAGNAFLKTSDASGTTSLTGATNWTINATPSSANDYYTSNFFLRTPTGNNSVVTFAGHSLTLMAPSGQSSPNRSMLFKGGTNSFIIINNLTNAGGVIDSGSGNISAPTFTGNLMTVVSNSAIVADQGSFIIGYPLAGSADLTNSSGNATTITFTNNNSAFTGRFIITNNVTVAFTSPNGGPGNPAISTPSQIDLGTGCTLLDLAGITLANANGGVTLEGNATINVSSNTMTIAEPITDNGLNFNLIKRGGAVLTLSGNNTFGGGLTLFGITAGSQLNINSPTALGTGTFTINNGNNAQIDNTSGAALTLANNNAQTWANSFVFVGSRSLNMGSGTVSMSGSLTVTVSNNNLTVGPVTDNGGGFALTKAGAGTLSINGGGSYSGATTVSGGTLAVTGSGSINSTVFNLATNATLDMSAVGGLSLPVNGILTGGTVIGGLTDNSSTIINPGGSTTAGTLTVNGDLTLNGGGTLNFDLNGSSTAAGGGTNDLVIVTGMLNLANPGTTISIGGIPSVGTYTLFQYGSLSGSIANLSVPAGYSLVNNTGINAVQLVVTNVPVSLTWVGDGSGNVWDVATTGNWKQGATPGSVFITGDTVTFDDTGSASPAINLTGNISPAATIVTNSANTYDFTGTGILTGSLTKTGNGTLILENSNSYSGPTVISGGTLQLGNAGGTTGSLGFGSVSNNGTLIVDVSTAVNFPAPISGTGTISVQAGAATLSASNNYSGLTTVSSGRLYVVNASSLGSTNAGTVVSSGGNIYITANVNIGLEPLTLNGVGDGSGALRKGGAGATAYNGAITLGSDSSIGIDSGSTLSLSNIVSGSAALTAVGNGTLGFNAPNSFTGGFTLNGPVVDLNTNGTLGTNTVTVSGVGRFILANGVNLTNFVQASTVSPGVATGLLMVNDNTNNIITTVSGPLEFDATAANGNNFFGPTSSGYLSVTGPITNNATGVVGSRNGFVRLSGGGSYTAFVLNQGTVSIGANNGLCTNATLSVGPSGNAAFDLNGFNQTLSGLTDTGSATKSITNSAASLVTLTLDLSSANTFDGVIGGNLALVENGSGSLYLTNNNLYTGNTTINGGTLELATPSLTATSTVTVATGAILQLDFTATNTVAALVLGGISQPAGLYNSTTSPSFITGSGSLQIGIPIAPNPTNMIAHVSGAVLSLSWPADHLGWILQAQTNSLAGGLTTTSNTWTDVSGSAGYISNNFTMDPTKPAVFYRLRHP